jgi:putative acetyltransferase
VRIREATAADVPALAALYADAVRSAGPAHYNAAQVEAWAAFADSLPRSSGEDRFRRFVLDPLTLVTEDDSGVTGFAGLAADGHVTALYVRSDRMRRGIGSALMRAVIERAKAQGIERLYTEASAFSRPVFARHGFRLDEVEVVERRGATFERYRMSREFNAG